MNPVLIFGASTRAAAFSAIRAGFDPICGDMFADADLRAFATVLDVPHYPHGLAKAVQHLHALPWIYTGALENSPSQIDSLCERNTLWGNSSESLKRCRDPWFCRDILQREGLPTLALQSSSSPPPRDAAWLVKPLRSAAGRAIAVWNEGAQTLVEPHYFQQLSTGTPVAAAYLATSASVEFMGVSQQLIGRSDLHAPAFGYCGSNFPWSGSDPNLEQSMRRIGSVIGHACRLRGLFGIDFIFDGQTAWLTEVNPRYTASMELIEYQLQLPLLAWHRQACEDTLDGPPLNYTCPVTPGRYCGKVVLYADRAARAPDLSAWIPRSVTLGELPELADIPVTGTEIFPGQPVFTCMGAGNDADTLRSELVERAQRLWQTFPNP